MRALFANVPQSVPLGEALREVIVAFNEVPPDQMEIHRQHMLLILRVPALQAYSTLKYTQWRDVIAGFAAERTHVPPDNWDAQFVGHVALVASLARSVISGSIGMNVGHLMVDSCASRSWNWPRLTLTLMEAVIAA